MEWTQILASNGELQKVNEYKVRQNLISSLKDVRKKIIDKGSTYFYWYFDVTEKLVEKPAVAFVVRVGSPTKKIATDAEKELKTHLEKLGLKLSISNDDLSAHLAHYGKDGLDIFHQFMHATCAFALERNTEKYQNMTEQNFLHFFISTLGYYYPQEAMLYMDLFAARMALMFPYPTFKEYKDHVMRVLDDHLEKHYRKQATQ